MLSEHNVCRGLSGLSVCKQSMNWSLVSLLAVALFCGVAWRVELEWRWGWATLEWAWQYYWAFLIGAVCFTSWAIAVAQPLKRWRFGLAMMALFALTLEVFWILLQSLFTRWLGPPPDNIRQFIWLSACLTPVLWAGVPLILGWICRWHGIRIHFGLHILSSILFVVSWPFAVWLLDIVDHQGGADLIHALKSGFVIPLLVISLGFPLLCARRPGGKSPPLH
jgi:glucan phosphoethanolaminetransferase (alkaline phosphatase superfamily)